MRILPGVCSCGFLCKAAVCVVSGFFMQSRRSRASGLFMQSRRSRASRAFASRANAVSGKCGFPSSAAVPEPYRHELSFCASTCASVRGQEHYHKSSISSTFLVFFLDFRAKSRGVLPKIFLLHQCFGRYFRNKAIFS